MTDPTGPTGHTEPSRRIALDEELCKPQAAAALWPPCRAACPAGTDARGYLEAIAYGRWAEAFRIAREPNPMVATCSFICHHPCEQECRRREVDEPLSIRGLKRWAVERGRPSIELRAAELAARVPGPSGKKVTIVGSGPAGLAAAEALALAGHAVTILERRPTPGGQLANTIPLYRLPREALAADVAEVAALGVRIETGVEVGTDVAFAALTREADAVVVAIGLSASRSLPIEGMEHESVLLALEFLESCAREADAPGGPSVKPHVEGKRVIVIGGGNVAVDVARTAVRLGAASVRMVCLESEAEMPAWDWEIVEAVEEGVLITCSKGPKRVIIEGGVCAGLETKAVECVFDEQGRFAPRFFEDRIEPIEGDTVVVTIGQMADYRAVEGELAIDAKGRLVFDPARMATSVRNVFACGEVVTGPGAAIEAVASGKRAARAVDGYLASGRIEALPPEPRAVIDPLPDETATLVPRRGRAPMPQVEPSVRRSTFEAFELGFAEEAALAEARRCLLCGAGAVVLQDKCATCVTCERVCPFGVPSIKGVGWAPAVACQACGVCAIECPAAAITMNAIDPLEAHDAVSAVMAGRSDVETLLIACAQHRATTSDPPHPPGVVEAAVTCAGRIRVEDVLHAYELGARRVVVSVCAGGMIGEKDADLACRYREAGVRAEQRLSRVAELLPQIGLDFESFSVVRTEASAEGGGAP